MKAFVLAHNAKTDLRAIALFTQVRWGLEQRNLYIKQLDETFHILGNSPALGNCCDEIMPGYRKFPALRQLKPRPGQRLFCWRCVRGGADPALADGWQIDIDGKNALRCPYR